MIRRIVPEDRERYLELARAFYHSKAVLHPVPEEYLRAAFEEMTGPSPYLEGYFLLSEGRVAGYALLVIGYSQEAGGRQIWLDELYVEAEARGRGLGREFLNYLREHCAARRLRLEVAEDNARAMRLYEKMGYSVLPYVQMVFDI